MGNKKAEDAENEPEEPEEEQEEVDPEVDPTDGMGMNEAIETVAMGMLESLGGN